MGFGVCLDPEEPTFFGFLLMNSLHKSLKKVGSSGSRWGLEDFEGFLHLPDLA